MQVTSAYEPVAVCRAIIYQEEDARLMSYPSRGTSTARFDISNNTYLLLFSSRPIDRTREPYWKDVNLKNISMRLGLYILSFNETLSDIFFYIGCNIISWTVYTYWTVFCYLNVKTRRKYVEKIIS